MKTRLEWFIVPCVASMFSGNAVNLKAQDPDKPKRNLSVVIHQADDEVDAQSIRDKVAKGLANSGISEENKARILKEVEDALNKAKDAAKKAAKVTVKGLEDATKSAKEAVREAVIEIQNNAKSPSTTHAFTTRVFRDPKNESFRIGIQCVQVEDGDDSETKQGLEVKAVVDDSPAKKAGIEAGDVLVIADATKISKIEDLTNVLQEAGKKDKEIKLELKRGDKVINITVKPTKMKSSDVALENIELSLPTGGFVLDGEAMKSFQEQMKKFGAGKMPMGGAQVWNFKDDSSDLKKDLEAIKSEMAELKKMIKEMMDKK